MENKMKSYLGTEYREDNHLMNWLIYWRRGEDTENKSDKWRLENDLDCLYIGDLKADTIISIYQILKRITMRINPKINLGIKKEVVEMLLKKENFEQLLPEKELLVQKLQLLAQKAELRSNFMLLQDRGMQTRGFRYADEMPPTLYQCFDDGVYSKYFNYDNKIVKQWVEREKLTMLFGKRGIDRNDIRPMIEGHSPKQSFKKTTKREYLLKIIEYSIEVLDERATVIM